MSDTNQQYKWRQRKKRNARITAWILFVILACAAGTFVYEGLKESNPQTVAENYIKTSTGVDDFTVDTGDRTLNKENQFVQDYTFTYTADGRETTQKVSMVQQNKKKYGLFDQWQMQAAGANAVDMELIVPAGVQVLIDRCAPDTADIKEDDTLSPGAVCYQLKGVTPESKLQINGLPFESYEGTLEDGAPVLDVRNALTVSENAQTQMAEIGKRMINELYTAAAQGKEASELGGDFAQVPNRENLYAAVSGSLYKSGKPAVTSIRCEGFEPTFGDLYYPGRDEESFIGIEMKLAYTCEAVPAGDDEEQTSEAESESESESESKTEAPAEAETAREATFYFRYHDGSCTVTSAEIPGVL